MKIRTFISVVALSCLTISSATAQDSSDWSGAFVGVQVGRWSGNGSEGATQNFVLGYDVVRAGAGSSSLAYIFGGRLSIGRYNYDDPTYYPEMYVLARVGWLPNPSTLIYGFAGPGIDDGDGAIQFGVGAEIAVGGGVSLSAEVSRGAYPDGSDPWSNWYFGANKRF